MRKLLPAIVIILLLITFENNYAQDKGLGLGIIIGEPTGLSGKYWLNNNNALDFGLAYSFVRHNSAVSLHADYLYHAFDVIKSDYRFPIYYGFGARLRLVDGDDNALGARGVIGVAWLSDKLPIDVFLELVPVFNLFPSTSLNFDMGFGARFYLN
jgi:hypothetical protein